MRDAVQQNEKIPPADDLLPVPPQVKIRLLASAHKQLVDALLRRQLLERLLRVHDRERHQHAPRPRRYLIDIEVEPVGEQYDLRRNGGHRVVVVLPERTEIDLGERVALHHTAIGQHTRTRLHHHRVVLGPAHQLQRQIRLHAVVDERGAPGILAPSAVFLLVAQDLVDRALHLAAIARAQHRVHEDVVRLQHRIGLQLAAPVALRMLLAKQPVGGPRYALRDLVQPDVHPAIAWPRGHCRSRLRILWKCTHRFQTLWIAKPLIVLGLANLELQLASFSQNRPA